MAIYNDECKLFGKVWGQPCNKYGCKRFGKEKKPYLFNAKRTYIHSFFCVFSSDSANITVNDVLAQPSLLVRDSFQAYSAAFFVPYCVFPKPKKG